VANTSYLRREVEGYVRGRLSEEFDQPFTSEFLALRPGGRHEFDAVSADGAVVASVKSASGLTSGGQDAERQDQGLRAELYYFSLVDAPIRRLVFTTPAFFGIFEKVTAGAIADGLEVVCRPLPPEIQQQVDLIVQEASKEVTPAAAAAAVASQVEKTSTPGRERCSIQNARPGI
jgi:hypothetical protein